MGHRVAPLVGSITAVIHSHRMQTMNLEHYKKIMDIVQETEKSGDLIQARELTGLSGEKVVGTLQRLAKFQNGFTEGCYLEIGVFQGLTLISVASVLDGSLAYGVDNFAQFDPKGVNERIVKKRAELNGLNNIRLINADYEEALENLEKHIGDSKIGLYFVDGPHDYRSQLTCLNLARPHLSANSVIVVDDCNFRHVRLANRDFLFANPEFKLLFEAYTDCHPCNMDKNGKEEARKGWWNGVNMIVRDPDNTLSVMFPETHRDRALFENDNIVHSAKYGVLAPEAIFFVQSTCSLHLMSALKQLAKMWIKLRKNRKQSVGKYPSMNTYSERLPKMRCNETLR
jgi:hypothetical protein